MQERVAQTASRNVKVRVGEWFSRSDNGSGVNSTDEVCCERRSSDQSLKEEREDK